MAKQAKMKPMVISLMHPTRFAKFLHYSQMVNATNYIAITTSAALKIMQWHNRCISYNTGKSALPDTYTQHPRASAYVIAQEICRLVYYKLANFTNKIVDKI